MFVLVDIPVLGTALVCLLCGGLGNIYVLSLIVIFYEMK